MKPRRTVRVASIGGSVDDGELSTGTGALMVLGAIWLLTEWGRRKVRG